MIEFIVLEEKKNVCKSYPRGSGHHIVKVPTGLVKYPIGLFKP